MDEAARKLVTENMPYAKAVARGILRSNGLHPRSRLGDEIFSAANLGLCLAATKFDPARGIPFPAYARRYILWQVYEEFRVWTPRGYRRRGRGRPGVQLFADMPREGRDAPDESAGRPVEIIDAKDQIEVLMTDLPAHHRRVIEWAYGEDGILSGELARKLGVSRQAIQAQRNRALASMRLKGPVR